MKLVFAHDHKLRKIGNKYYTVGGLRDSITSRYFKYFDELTIFCRSIEKQPFDTQLFEIKNPKITIKPVSSGSLLISKQAKKMMEEEIKISDAVIVKLHSRIAEIAIHYARKYKKPYLIESVGCPWDAYWNYSFKGKLVAPIMTVSTKYEIKRAPYVIYVTKEFLERRYPTNGKWTYCSDVELNDINDEVLAHRLKKIESFKEPIILGTLAQVDVKYKGQEYVIKAILKLKQMGITCKYKLAGSGNDEYLRNIATKYGVLDQVEFCGVLSHDEVFEWLDNIDLYVQPSKQEGLPRSMIEAISRGCPAIGSNVGGIGELIGKDYLFKKGNSSEIVRLVASFNKDSLKQAAIRNFANSKNYEIDYLNKKRDKFYSEFANFCRNSKDH